MIYLVSTRFNNDTWLQNEGFRKKYNYTGCIYGVPQPMSPKIEIDGSVFVLEMNNTSNQIEGIGFIKNNLRLDKYYKIYHEGNYNRYVFKGKYRINRDHLFAINPILVDTIENILFKEKTHLKRGMGFTSVPEKLLSNKNRNNNLDIKEEIKRIFIRMFSN
jgi:hypothetical protein